MGDLADLVDWDDLPGVGFADCVKLGEVGDWVDVAVGPLDSVALIGCFCKYFSFIIIT